MFAWQNIFSVKKRLIAAQTRPGGTQAQVSANQTRRAGESVEQGPAYFAAPARQPQSTKANLARCQSEQESLK